MLYKHFKVEPEPVIPPVKYVKVERPRIAAEVYDSFGDRYEVILDLKLSREIPWSWMSPTERLQELLEIDTTAVTTGSLIIRTSGINAVRFLREVVEGEKTYAWVPEGTSVKD